MTGFELRWREKHDFFMQQQDCSGGSGGAWPPTPTLTTESLTPFAELQGNKAGFNVYVEMVRCDTCPLTATILQWQWTLWCPSRQQMVAVLLCSFLDRIWRLEFGVPTSRWTSLWGAKEADIHYKLICLERRDVLGMVPFLSHIKTRLLR